MLMLLFYINNKRYACSCEHIIEIVPKLQLNYLPQIHEHVVGMLNYRGTPIPILDLCKMMEGYDSSNCYHTRIVIVQSPESKQMIGFIAEKITETIELDITDFVHSGVHVEKFPFIGGIHCDEQGMIRNFLVVDFFNTIDKLCLFRNKMEKIDE